MGKVKTLEKSHASKVTREDTVAKKSEHFVAGASYLEGFQFFIDGAAHSGKITGMEFWTPREFTMKDNSIFKK